MTLNKQGVFSFNHTNQQDDLYKAKTATEVKQAFDSRGEELKTTLNTLIDSLQSSANGDSGAKNIGAETIQGLTGNDVQTLLQALKNQMDSTVLGQIPNGAVTKPKLSSDILIQLIDYATSTGSANTYAITLSSNPTSYTDGMAVSVKINVDCTSASTLNINGLGAIPLKKSNGSDVINLKANGFYTFRYNSSTGNFILQGEGGSGTATAGDILTGKTATTDVGDITGTMTNRGAMTITPGTTDQIIPVGYHDGNGKVPGDPDKIPSNIKQGVNIDGVDGSLVPGKSFAIGTLTTAATSINVTGLTFTPKTVIVFSRASADTNSSGIYVYTNETLADSNGKDHGKNAMFLVGNQPTSVINGSANGFFSANQTTGSYYQKYTSSFVSGGFTVPSLSGFFGGSRAYEWLAFE